MDTAASRTSVDVILSTFRRPDGISVVDANMVRDVSFDGAKVTIVIAVRDPDQAAALEGARRDAQKQILALEGVTDVHIILTSDAATTHDTAEHHASGLSQVQYILAVSSAKGGVGKSTVATNLAATFAAMGKKTGLLDADIYGPSVQIMLGLTDAPELDGDTLMPLEAFGIKAATMGSLVDPDASMVWRGPMVVTALMQLANDVEWGPLDILIIDMPPGTGDVHLTVAQRMNVGGAVIVTTPQDVALQDTRKGIDMFRKVGVPVIGLIENMSYFLSQQSGEKEYIFGKDGGRKTAEAFHVPFLGALPLQTQLREGADKGQPAALNAGSEPQRQFKQIAMAILAQINTSSG